MSNRHERRKQEKSVKRPVAAPPAGTAERISRAVALHRAGQVDQAERLYHEALRLHPNHPDALHLLGAVALQRGDLNQAETRVRQAITAAPDFAAAHDTLGTILARLGRHAEAAKSYQRSLRLRPDFPATLTNMGVALAALGRLADAESAHRRAIELHPGASLAHTNLGNTLRAAGRLEDAAAAHHQAVTLDPNYAEGHNNLGIVLHENKQLEEAEAAFRQSLALRPDNAIVWSNLGTLLFDRRRFDDAVNAHQRAVALNPLHAEARNNLGLALQALGDLTGAAASFREAIALNPQLAGAHLNLGIVLNECGDADSAIQSMEQAILVGPAAAGPFANLGATLLQHGRLTEAVARLRQAVAVDPSYADAWSNLGNALLPSGEFEEALVHYRRAIELTPESPSKMSNWLLAQQYCPGVTAEMLADAHRPWEERFGSREIPLHTNLRDPVKILRVGFVSADFGRHPIGFFALKLLENHDPKVFTAVCYSCGRRPDAVTERLKAAADEWHAIRNTTHAELAERIRGDTIDVLFDMAGHTAHNRLRSFGYKPAPLQVTWAGYVGTTGLAAMDYLLADRYQVPADEEVHYREQVLRMPNDYICYTPPEGAPDVAPLPARTNGFITFGCFNNPAKINNPLLDAWAEILGGLPKSRLFLKYSQMDDPIIRQRVAGRLGEHGIDPSRLIFEPRSPHRDLLAAYGRVDIALDTFPYSGGLTTCEALWMGVPVVTFPGATFAGRHSTSHLSNVGLTETIAADVDGYIATAVALARNLDHLAELRATLRQQMAASPLCDGPRFARDFESMLRGIWQAWCAEETAPPTS